MKVVDLNDRKPREEIGVHGELTKFVFRADEDHELGGLAAEHVKDEDLVFALYKNGTDKYPRIFGFGVAEHLTDQELDYMLLVIKHSNKHNVLQQDG